MLKGLSALELTPSYELSHLDFLLADWNVEWCQNGSYKYIE